MQAGAGDTRGEPEHRPPRELRHAVRAPGAPSRDLESMRGRACWLHHKSRVTPHGSGLTRRFSPGLHPCSHNARLRATASPAQSPAVLLSHPHSPSASFPSQVGSRRGHSDCGAAGLVRPSALTHRGPSAVRRGPEETGGPASVAAGGPSLRGALAPRHGAPGVLFGVLVIHAQGAFTSVLSAGGLRPCLLPGDAALLWGEPRAPLVLLESQEFEACSCRGIRAGSGTPRPAQGTAWSKCPKGIGEWMGGQTDAEMDGGQTGEWMDIGVDGWTDGYRDEW